MCTEKNAKEDEYKFTIKKYAWNIESENHIIATYESADASTYVTTQIGKLPLITSKFIF